MLWLGVPAAAVATLRSRQGRRHGFVDDMAFDPLADKHTVQPESIKARFVNNHHGKAPAGPSLRFCLEIDKARE